MLMILILPRHLNIYLASKLTHTLTLYIHKQINIMYSITLPDCVLSQCACTSLPVRVSEHECACGHVAVLIFSVDIYDRVVVLY